MSQLDAISELAAAPRTPVDWAHVRARLGTAAVATVAFLPLLVGYLVGAAWWVCRYARAGYLTGLRGGRGTTATPAPKRRG